MKIDFRIAHTIKKDAGDFFFLHNNMIDSVVDMTGNCLNLAMSNASAEAAENNKMFVPQNWIKSKASLKDIRTATRQYLATLKMMPGGKHIFDNLEKIFAWKKKILKADGLRIKFWLT